MFNWIKKLFGINTTKNEEVLPNIEEKDVPEPIYPSKYTDNPKELKQKMDNLYYGVRDSATPTFITKDTITQVSTQENDDILSGLALLAVGTALLNDGETTKQEESYSGGGGEFSGGGASGSYDSSSSDSDSSVSSYDYGGSYDSSSSDSSYDSSSSSGDY